MLLRRTLLAAALCAAALPAAAQQQVNVICPMAAEWCNMAATEFEKTTGIKVSLANMRPSDLGYLVTTVTVHLDNQHRTLTARVGAGQVDAAHRGDRCLAGLE